MAKIGASISAKIGLASFSNVEISAWAEFEESELQGNTFEEKAADAQHRVSSILKARLEELRLLDRFHQIMIDTIEPSKNETPVRVLPKPGK